MLAAILRPHFAGVRVQNAVATAGRLGTTPTRFTTMSCGLAVLLIRTHDALTASEQLHLTRGLVDVSIASANRSVERRVIARDRTILPVGRNIVARPKMRQLDSDPADLHPEHALVQVGTPVGAAHWILIARAAVLALATG